MIEIDNEIFQRNLLLTKTYCELQLKSTGDNLAIALRTFNPVVNKHKLFAFEKGNCSGEDFISVKWGIHPLLGDKTLYDELFYKQLLNKNNSTAPIDITKKFGGRILVAEIDLSVIDGASEVESMGFVDINDCPPIDTWFYKIVNKEHRVFFTWVPQQFVELANKAIEVNCVDCLLWYEDWLLREKISSIKFKQSNTKSNFLKLFNKLF